jgi:hypothetical protein
MEDGFDGSIDGWGEFGIVHTKYHVGNKQIPHIGHEQWLPLL